MIRKAIEKNVVFIIGAFILSFLLIYDTTAYNVKISYGDMPKNNQNVPKLNGSIITNKDDVPLSSDYLINDKYSYGVIRSSQWTRSGNKLIFHFNRYEDNELSEAVVEKISFRLLFFTLYTIDYKNYANAICEANESYISERNEIVIPIGDHGNEISVLSDFIINNGQIKIKIYVIKGLIVLLFLLLIITFIWLDVWTKSSEKANKYKWTILLLIITCLIMGMSLYGTNLSGPDEDGSIPSVQYYYNHWGLPDFNTEEARATFCNYGSSRLNQKTPYFFFAGKIGLLIKWIVGNDRATRVFNVVLFALLVILYISKGDNNKWLLIGLILTPQLWYIFSYTTSDAWDYFISYIIITLLVIGNKPRNRILFSILRGVLFAVLFMGKKNYYTVLLFSFFIYLIEYLAANKNIRRKLMLEYGIILITTAIIYSTRVLIDFLYYGGQKAAMLEEIGDSYKKVTIMSLQTLGKDLSYVLLETNLVDRLIKSFFGIFGWMKYESGKIYYWVIEILYAGLMFFFIKGTSFRKNKIEVTKIIISLGMIAIAVFAVVGHCWINDFQPQGRYLFGMIPCVMYAFSRNDKIVHSRLIEYCFEGIVLVSIYSFIMYGMSNIIV